MSNDYDSGRDARVTMNSSNYDSDNTAMGGGQVVIGGLHSGGQSISERGEDSSVRVMASSPTLGGGFTASTADGFPISSVGDLQPDSVITLPNGMQTSWEVAKMQGLVSPEALQQAQQEQQQAENEQEQRQDQKTTEPMDQAAESIMRDALDRAEGATIGAMVSVIAEDGVLSATSAEELAAALQVEPAVIYQRHEVAMKGYREDAYRGAARAARTDEALAAEALQDARENRRSDLNEKMQHHFMHGTTSQYGGLVSDFVSGLAATDPGRVLSAETDAGITVSQDTQGEVIVTIDGNSYRYEDAVRNRLVSVTSGRKR